MRAGRYLRVLAALLPGLFGLTGFGQTSPAALPSLGNAGLSTQAAVHYAQLPLSFEANRGQADKGVKFLSRGSGYSLFLTDSSAVLALSKPDALNLKPGSTAGSQPKAAALQAGRTDVVRMGLAGGRHGITVTGSDLLPGTANYFIGNDPAGWRSGVPTFAKVKYAGIYPGIDLVYYGSQGRLEYDFVVAPGASSKAIRLEFTGATKLGLTTDGDLTVSAANGEIAFHKPVVYQDADGRRQPVEGHFALLSKNAVGFTLGRYDHSKPLVIDPVLTYSTYLGGSLSDGAYGIAADSAGNAYVVGSTFSTNFPVTSGAFQPTNKEPSNFQCVFVSKLNPTGTALVYSTYLGGSGNTGNNAIYGDVGEAIAVDGSGDAYVTGLTQSTSFPVTSNAYQKVNKSTLKGPWNAFVTKLNATGTALVYSTYLGGTSQDYASGIAVDSSGNAYVVGRSTSGNFPTTEGAFQVVNHASTSWFNAFVTKFNPTGSALEYSTYLGGSSYGATGSGIAVDSSGDAYVVGSAASQDFPITSDAYQVTNKAVAAAGPDSVVYNAFVTKFNSTGTALEYSTFLGGSIDDYGSGIALDGSGDAYVTGQSWSSDYPVAGSPYQSTNKAYANDGYNAFVTEVNPAGTELVYSTFLGGTGIGSQNANESGSGDAGTAIAVDGLGDAYVTGSATSSNFPTTSGAYQTVNNAAGYPGSKTYIGVNAFITKLNPYGSGLLYSTYLGGSVQDQGNGIALDGDGGVYVAGTAESTNFPTTTGAYQTANGGGYSDAFIAKLAIGSVVSEVATPTFSPAPGTYSSTQSVSISDSTSGATIYYTTNGDTPTTSSTKYTAKISVANSETIKAIAVASGFTESKVASGAYQIGGLTFSATSLSFGSLKYGTVSGSQSVTMTNIGAVAISISSIAVTGADASSFVFANTCGSSLAAGANCSIHGHFGPTAVGQLTAAITITDNSAGSPQTIALSGTGTGVTTVSLSPSSLSFGTQAVGTASASKSVTLTNTGGAALSIAGVSMTGADATSFVFANNCGTTLAAGANCSIHGHFGPVAAGALTAAITITDDATGSPHTVSLSGTGQGPIASLSATSLSFGSQAVGMTSASQSVTLTNTGNEALSITGISMTGADASSFVFANNCGTSLAAGANCSIHGHFGPTAAGALTAAITITDNAFGSPQTISLSGTGLGPAVSLSATSLAFGTQTVGTASASKSVTLTNTGSETLSISSITVVGADASSFAFANTCPTSPSSLGVGASCTIHGHFAPTAVGSLTATITITDNAGNSSQSVALSGTGDSSP